MKELREVVCRVDGMGDKSHLRSCMMPLFALAEVMSTAMILDVVCYVPS